MNDTGGSTPERPPSTRRLRVPRRWTITVGALFALSLLLAFTVFGQPWKSDGPVTSDVSSSFTVSGSECARAHRDTFLGSEDLIVCADTWRDGWAYSCYRNSWAFLGGGGWEGYGGPECDDATTALVTAGDLPGTPATTLWLPTATVRRIVIPLAGALVLWLAGWALMVAATAARRGLRDRAGTGPGARPAPQ